MKFLNEISGWEMNGKFQEENMDEKQRLEELKKTLEYHIDRYYNQDSPEITDYEYDMMMQELKKL